MVNQRNTEEILVPQLIQPSAHVIDLQKEFRFSNDRKYRYLVLR